MSQVFSSRRLRWLVVGAIAAILTIGSIAIGVAHNGSPSEIRLILDHDKNEFVYGGARQKISTGYNWCSVNPDKYGTGIVKVETGTFDWKGDAVKGNLGLVQNGLGVNEKGWGFPHDCGRVDYLGSGRSETLSFAVGPAVQNQVFTYVDFDLGVKHDAKVQFDFYQGATNVGTQVTELGSQSNHKINTWFHSKDQDNYRVFAYPTAPDGAPITNPPTEIVPFDRVVITMLKGAVSVEGGGSWDKDHGYFGPSSPTIFYLTSARTEIAIDTTVSGYPSDDLGFVPTGTELVWDFAVTNTGDLPLSNVIVADVPGLSISGPTGDNGDGILSATEVWHYSATSTVTDSSAGGTGETHVTTATGQSVDKLATASDTVTYFGMSELSIDMDKTTSGSNDGGVYSGPGNDVLITAGDDVIWTYTVTNNSNVPLTIAVNDVPEGAANCPNSALAPGASFDCTKSGIAGQSDGVAHSDGTYTGGYTNSATATGTHTPTGTTTNPEDPDATDSSGYFGMYRSLYVEVSNNGVGTPPVVSGPEVVWTVFARNDGNVAIDVIVAEQDLPGDVDPNKCDIPSPLEPGNEASCEIRTPVVDGEQTTSFTVRGEDPLGMVIEKTSGTVGYYGGLACGDSTASGGPDVNDTPLAGFFVGPSSKDEPDECAVPVEIVTENDPGASEQSVFIGAPAGYSWLGVTGLLTVEWDIEDPAAGLQPTLQTIGGSTTEVPVCAGDTAVEILEPLPGDWKYRLAGDSIYPDAVAGGDVCLVQTTTTTINYVPDGGGPQVVKSVTIDVFYIWNDPTLSRPR
jgi:hypothetical protein